MALAVSDPCEVDLNAEVVKGRPGWDRNATNPDNLLIELI
jgi:hypothetical protein